MNENWIELTGYSKYMISDQGRVLNSDTDLLRRSFQNQLGITMLRLTSYNGKQVTRSLAVMVAEAFVEGRSDTFDCPIHLDGNRKNCNADNLMWRPRWFAVRYHKQFNNHAFHNATPKIRCEDTGEKFYTMKDPATKYGMIGMEILNAAVNGQCVFPQGYTFCQF